MKRIIIILLITASCQDKVVVREPELYFIANRVVIQMEKRGVYIDLSDVSFVFDDNLIKEKGFVGYYKNNTIYFDAKEYEKRKRSNLLAIYTTMAHELGHHLGIGHLPKEANNLMSSPKPAVSKEKPIDSFYDDLSDLVLRNSHPQ